MGGTSSDIKVGIWRGGQSKEKKFGSIIEDVVSDDVGDTKRGGMHAQVEPVNTSPENFQYLRTQEGFHSPWQGQMTPIPAADHQNDVLSLSGSGIG